MATRLGVHGALACLTLTSCKYDCEIYTFDEIYLLREGGSCPNLLEVNLDDETPADAWAQIEEQPYAPDRLMCWYRRTAESPTECRDEPREGIGYSLSRTYYLTTALNKAPRPYDSLQAWQEVTVDPAVSACDESGSLVGLLLTDSAGQILEVNEGDECPEIPQELPPWSEPLGPLVGSDFYPALVTCSYVFKRTATCGGLGSVPLGLN